jgi:hypothetical protein
LKSSETGLVPGVGGRSIAALLACASLLTAPPPDRLAAQGTVDAVAVRLAGMTAVTGLEQAVTDTLLTLVPGSARDRAGNVTVTLGTGAPRRLVACALDEVGYVVGNITADGYLTLRRVGITANPLFDQQLEGERVTVFGARGPVPGVVAVKSVHLTRGRAAGATPDPVFTVDNAYVDVGAATAAEAHGLGIDLLAPVALAKRPHLYGDRRLAAPAAGRRATCAALAAAIVAAPRVRGTVVAAFTVRSLYATTGLQAVQNLQGPFERVLVLGGGRRTRGPAPDTLALASRYVDTAVETVSLRDADALAQQVVAWMEGR